MHAKTKLREMWDVLAPPAVEEDASDTGTCVYAPTYHLFLLRVICGIVSMICAFTTYERWAYRFPHVFAYLYIIESLCFFALAAASLSVMLDRNRKHGIFVLHVLHGSMMEALYYTSGTLCIAATIFHTPYFPALLLMLAHFALVPKIRVRTWFVIIPVALHVPHTVRELLYAEFRDHADTYSYGLDLFGLFGAGVIAIVLTEILKHAEARNGKGEYTELGTGLERAI